MATLVLGAAGAAIGGSIGGAILGVSAATIGGFVGSATYRPHPDQITATRRSYTAWWQALGWVRDGLMAGGMLREVEVTEAMPAAAPWQMRARSGR